MKKFLAILSFAILAFLNGWLVVYGAMGDSITAAYLFNTGALTTDSVAGTYTLTNTNSVAETASGKIGYGADFGSANTNKRFETTNSIGLAATPFTVSLWTKMQTPPTSGNRMAFYEISYKTGSNSTTHQIQYFNSSGTLRLEYYLRGTGGYVAYTSDLGTTEWKHLAIKWDGTNVFGFLNGVQVATVAGNGVEAGGSSLSSAIGAAIPEDNRYFCSCFIDEVYVWNRALSNDEINLLHNQGTGWQYPFTATSSPAVSAIYQDAIILE